MASIAPASFIGGRPVAKPCKAEPQEILQASRMDSETGRICTTWPLFAPAEIDNENLF